MLAGACNKPPNLVCRPVAIFQVLEPKQGAGGAPFSIERLGGEVKWAQLQDNPRVLALNGRDKHGHVDWSLLGHIYAYTELIYSPVEGLARDVKHPEEVYPMKRFSDGMSEHVRFGFTSRICRHGEMIWGGCDWGDEELFLVADMNCERK